MNSPELSLAERFVQFLEEKWITNKQCAICQSETWHVKTDGGHMPVLNFDSKNVDFANGYPLILLMCHTCGNTLFFNPLVTGFIETNG